MIPECLKGLIGLTDIDCECIEGERPDEWNASSSGCYLTDHVPLDALIFQQEKCYCGESIWKLMQKCIDKSCQNFCVDMSAALYSDSKLSRLARFSGIMGKGEISSAVSSTKKYAGFCFRIKKTIKGGFLHLGCLNVAFDSDCEVTVHIENISTGEAIDPITVPTKAGVWANLPNNIDIPMVCDHEYKVWYEVPEDCKPLNNKLHCCSKSVDKTPCLRYVDLNGFTTDDIENCVCTEKLAFGLQLEVYLKCDDLAWICSLEKVGDHKLLNIIAKTLLWKASAMFMDKLRKQNALCGYLLVQGESMQKDMYRWGNHYKKNIEFIKQNIPLDLTDCLNCNPNQWGYK